MRKRKDVMLATSFSEKRFETWPRPILAQPKIEGDRCRAVISRFGDVTLYSSSSRVIVGVPHINRHLEELELPYPTELDGELYKHGMPHEEIRSRVSRTVGLHLDHEAIEYHIFDRINKASQIARLGELKLQSFFLSLNEKVQLVQSQEVYTMKEVEVYLNQCMKEGYEGIILRHPFAPYKRSAPGHATNIMKLKPRLEGVYDIVSCEEERTIYGEPKDALGALVLTLPHTDRAFKVGTGFTRQQREDYWSNLKQVLKKRARIRYQSLTEDRGVPKMSSFVRLED